ncbi:hypothetical protein C8Q79DRAFT_219316 [Trametes meyenii]|nr:hypothetical protein C8Q79DRAFT_219316 [Trametes meyenii]
MASWVLAHPPWHTFARLRVRWDVLVRSGVWTDKHFLNTPPTSVETPAMREVKTYPYPATPPDTSLFEDITDEYHGAVGRTDAYGDLYPAHPVVDHPTTLLKNLVKHGKFQDASRVYTELVDMGVEIPPHPVYHFAARQVLLNRAFSQGRRVEEFVKWWSLFPPRTEVDGRRSVGKILSETLRDHPAPDMPLLIRFALLAASKGYAPLVWKDIICVVAWYTPSRVCVDFLHDFCSTARDFELRQGNDCSEEATNALLTPSFGPLYDLAITEAACVGRASSALDILLAAHAKEIQVSQETYDYLLHQFKEADDPEAMAVVNSLLQTRRGHPAWLELPTEETQETPHIEDARASIDDSDRARYPGRSITPAAVAIDVDLRVPSLGNSRSLVATARNLKHILARGMLPISTTQLEGLISTYLKVGRKSLVRRLRALAYRHGNLVPRWALAEMKRHLNRKRALSTLLKEFESHFHLVGVPRGVFDSLWEERLSKPSSEVVRWRPSLRRKMLPSAAHTRIVWETFLNRATSRSHIQRLYAQFLEDIAASREIAPTSVPFIASRPTSQPILGPTQVVRPIPPPSVFNALHFGLFIKAFQHHGMPGAASRVILDMYATGVKPDYRLVPAFVTSLRFLRRGPEAPAPIDVVRNYEEAIDKISPVTQRRLLTGHHWRQNESTPEDTNVAARDPVKIEVLLFVYMGVLSRLLLDNRREEAAAVAKRLRNRIPDHKRSAALVDQVLQHLGAITSSSPSP